MALEEIRNERIRKLKVLREKSLSVYPASVVRSRPIEDVVKKFSAYTRSKKKISVVGRIMAKREHGGSTFMDLKDGSGKIQLYFKKDILGDEYETARDVIDIGDFVRIEARGFLTKRKEPTLEVMHWQCLAKSLLPLPEKWHGLQDVEERFRKRYLDILMNEAVRERFLVRSRIIDSLREIFRKEQFFEAETPMFHSIAGGALAKPFVTHHNALDSDFYLRIAPELYLKRLLIGGFKKIYEIGKNFRNEGIDASHNPEFTMCECYVAYWDEKDMMKFVEKIMVVLFKEFGGKGTILSANKIIKIKTPFPRVTFKDLLSRYALITDYPRETLDSLAVRARQFGIEIGRYESKGKIADEIYKKICRPYLSEPTFVTNHPLEISPLAKARDEHSSEARRFQLIAGGMEIMNGFAELNDPIEQRKRMEAQEQSRHQGEDEAHRMDQDFIEALEYGMPPAAGLGIGIDRLVMLLTDTKNIREVILFPTLRPKT